MNKIYNRFRNILTLIPYELWIIILAAFFLRIYHLGYRDLWYDEIVTLSKIFNLTFLRAWNPPLYFAMLAGWVKIFGLSEFSLRFPSLLFSLACIPLIFLLGKELFNKNVGLYASLIMALSPFHLWYAQEARDYSIMLLCALLSVYFQFLFIKRQNKKFLYWCVFFSILGLYTMPYYVFFVITQFICYVFYFKGRWSAKMRIISILFVLLIPLSFVPLLRKTLVRISAVLKGYWIPSPNWKSFLITIENFNLGYNSHRLIYFISDILILILFISAIWLIKQKRELREGFIFCLILFVSPILLAFAFSKLVVSIYFERGLIITTPYYYLIIGLGITAFRKKILKVFVIISIFSLLIIGIYGFINDWMPTKHTHHYGVYLKKPVKPVIKFIKANSGPDDIIAFTNDSIMLPFLWYDRGKNMFVPKLKNDSTHDSRRYRFFFGPKSVTPSYEQPRRESQFNIPLDKFNELEFKNLWVLSCNWQRDGNLDENSSIVKERLNKDFDLRFEHEFDGLWVYIYTKK